MRRLPLLVERSVGELQAERLRISSDFERQVRNAGVSCLQGCSACCYYPISISVLEGLLIYRWLAEQHLWTLKLKKKFEEASEKTRNQALEVWMLSKIPCPLLVDDRCSAYEARPVLCRTMFSRGDPYYCDPHRLGSGQAGVVPRVAPLDDLLATETRLLKRHRMDLIYLPLSFAVLVGERISKGEIELEEVGRQLILDYVRAE